MMVFRTLRGPFNMGNIVLLTCGLMCVAASMKKEATQLLRQIAKPGHIEEPLITERFIDWFQMFGGKGPVKWTLVSANTECSGEETEKYLKRNAEIQDCANECDGVSSMFLFSPIQKRCYCETAATSKGSCTLIDNVPWDLYKYDNEGPTFVKESDKYCFQPYATDIGNIDEAKSECLKNIECLAIGSRKCNDFGYYLCREEKEIKDSSEESCIYRK